MHAPQLSSMQRSKMDGCIWCTWSNLPPTLQDTYSFACKSFVISLHGKLKYSYFHIPFLRPGNKKSYCSTSYFCPPLVSHHFCLFVCFCLFVLFIVWLFAFVFLFFFFFFCQIICAYTLKVRMVKYMFVVIDESVLHCCLFSLFKW